MHCGYLLSRSLIRTINLESLVVIVLGLICLVSLQLNAQTEAKDSFVSLHTKFVREYVPSDTMLLEDINTYGDLIHFISATENLASIDSLVPTWTEKRVLNDRQSAFLYYLAAQESDKLEVRIRFIQKSLDLYEKLEDVEGRINCLSFAVILNYDTNSEDHLSRTLIEAYEEVKTLMDQTSDSYTIRTAIRTYLDYTQRADELLDIKEVDDLFSKYKKISIDLPRDMEHVPVISAFGIAYWSAGEKDKAVALAQQNADYLDTTFREYFNELYNLGFLKNATGNQEEAKKILIRSIRYWPEFTTASEYSVAIYTAELLTDIYENEGKPDSALYYARKEVALTHQKMNFEIESARVESEYKFGLSRKEKALEHLASINKITNKQKNVLLVSGTCIAVLLFLALAISRKLKTSNTKLEQLIESRDQLITLIAHDLRTPLKTYQGLAESIDYLAQIKDWKRLNEVTGHIRQMGSDLDNMLSNMLFWGLQQENAAFTSKEKIDLNETVSQIQAPYQLIAQMKEITLEFIITGSHTGVGNSGVVSVILNNLLDNALKYGITGSFLRINLDLSSDYLQIETLSSTTEEHFERFKKAVDNQLREESGKDLSKGGFGWLIIRKMTAESKSQITLSGNHMECRLCINLRL